MDVKKDMAKATRTGINGKTSTPDTGKCMMLFFPYGFITLKLFKVLSGKIDSGVQFQGDPVIPDRLLLITHIPKIGSDVCIIDG
jgi:hypothetical protein